MTNDATRITVGGGTVTVILKWNDDETLDRVREIIRRNTEKISIEIGALEWAIEFGIERVDK